MVKHVKAVRVPLLGLRCQLLLRQKAWLPLPQKAEDAALQLQVCSPAPRSKPSSAGHYSLQACFLLQRSLILAWTARLPALQPWTGEAPQTETPQALLQTPSGYQRWPVRYQADTIISRTLTTPH